MAIIWEVFFVSRVTINEPNSLKYHYYSEPINIKGCWAVDGIHKKFTSPVHHSTLQQCQLLYIHLNLPLLTKFQRYFCCLFRNYRRYVVKELAVPLKYYLYYNKNKNNNK